MEPTPITLDALASAEPQTASSAPAADDAFARLMAAQILPSPPRPDAADTGGQTAAAEVVPLWPQQAPDSRPDAEPVENPREAEESGAADLIEAAAAQGVPPVAPVAIAPPSEAPQTAQGHANPRAEAGSVAPQHSHAPVPEGAQPATVVASSRGHAAPAEARADAAPVVPIGSLAHLPEPTIAAEAAPAASPEPARAVSGSASAETARAITAEAPATAETAGAPPRINDSARPSTFHPSVILDGATSEPAHPAVISAPAVGPRPATEATPPPTVAREVPTVAHDNHPPNGAPATASSSPPVAEPEPAPPVRDQAAIESASTRQNPPATVDPPAQPDLAARQMPVRASASTFDTFPAGRDEWRSPSAPVAATTVERDVAPAPQPVLSTPLPARPVGINPDAAEPSILAPATDAAVGSDGQPLLAAASEATGPAVVERVAVKPTATVEMAGEASAAEEDSAATPMVPKVAPTEPGDRPAEAPARPLTDWAVSEVARATDQEPPRERTGPALTGEANVHAAAAAFAHETREVTDPPAASRTPVTDQVAHAIARAVDDGRTQVTIRLEPPLLGTVRVTITLSDSGDISAQLNASSDLGRRLLDSGLPRLAAALTERGVDVGQLNVSVGGHDAPARFFDHSQGWQRPEHLIWEAPVATGLSGDGESVEPIRLISDGHHLIDLLA